MKTVKNRSKKVSSCRFILKSFAVTSLLRKNLIIFGNSSRAVRQNNLETISRPYSGDCASNGYIYGITLSNENCRKSINKSQFLVLYIIGGNCKTAEFRGYSGAFEVAYHDSGVNCPPSPKVRPQIRLYSQTYS